MCTPAVSPEWGAVSDESSRKKKTIKYPHLHTSTYSQYVYFSEVGTVFVGWPRAGKDPDLN